MGSRADFQENLRRTIASIGENYFSFNEEEFWMVRPQFEYIEYLAVKNGLRNTALALHLARGLHNGSYRKSTFERNGVSYRLPYLYHPLMVCRMLINLDVNLPMGKKDVLYAAALCHDMIEDVPFAARGRELVTLFGLDEEVYETVKLVSKRRDFTPEEEEEFFHQIELHPLALLVKLADRGNNVEDLYNMSAWKVHEYVGETRKYFLPMCRYGRTHYYELLGPIEILEEKITTLTEAAEILVDRYDAKTSELKTYRDELLAENERLRETWKEMWIHE